MGVYSHFAGSPIKILQIPAASGIVCRSAVSGDLFRVFLSLPIPRRRRNATATGLAWKLDGRLPAPQSYGVTLIFFPSYCTVLSAVSVTPPPTPWLSPTNTTRNVRSCSIPE
jgi:hypothetical protein